MALILYVKPGCHLCEEARLAIAHSGIRAAVRTRDISGDPQLTARYSLRIPVLQCSDTARELDWPFGPADINALSTD